MTLEIVWQNPLPLIRTERALQRIRSDQFGAVYAVTGPGSHAGVREKGEAV